MRLFGDDKINSISLRELYLDLEYDDKNFSAWAKRNLEAKFIEHVDWEKVLLLKKEDSEQAKEKLDYIVLNETYATKTAQPILMLTTDCAKHLAMSAQTVKGKEVRKYFIQCEKELRNQVQMTPLEQIAQTLAMANREIIAEKENSRLLDNVINSVLGERGLISFEHTTKLLYDRYGIQVGRNGFMKACRDVGLLTESNRPYQRYINWFKVVKKTTANAQVYDVTLVYEDKIKLIYKHIAIELQI